MTGTMETAPARSHARATGMVYLGYFVAAIVGLILVSQDRGRRSCELPVGCALYPSDAAFLSTVPASERCDRAGGHGLQPDGMCGRLTRSTTSWGGAAQPTALFRAVLRAAEVPGSAIAVPPALTRVAGHRYGDGMAGIPDSRRRAACEGGDFPARISWRSSR